MKRSAAIDYLWDGTGEPDDDVCRMEAVLAEFRYVPDARAPLDEDGRAGSCPDDAEG